jgi:lysylphosphatidylglycerol synthetase-like protein (DUF2156 family)
MARGYARSRERNEAARAALEPLPEGQRPRAVTVGAVAAGVLALANLVALIAGYDPQKPSKTAASALGIVLLGAISLGMWRARYWAVLGLQAILAIAIVVSALALVRAGNLTAVLVVVAIIVPSAVLFWFLVKAMARIQMPERPGTESSRQ